MQLDVSEAATLCNLKKNFSLKSVDEMQREPCRPALMQMVCNAYELHKKTLFIQ